MRRIRKDDQVEVIAGKDAGKTGRVVKLFTDRDRVLVEGVQLRQEAPADPADRVVAPRRAASSRPRLRSTSRT